MVDNKSNHKNGNYYSAKRLFFQYAVMIITEPDENVQKVSVLNHFIWDHISANNKRSDKEHFTNKTE